jgi:hypothetical protein
MLALFSNRYAQLAIAVLAALIFGFTSGYSYKADKVELERLQQFEKITEKLDKVYKFSQDESSKAKESDVLLTSKLNTILTKVKDKKLSSVPCTPSEEFSMTWRAIDNASKTTNTK